ncbi:MAG: hypothetical protein JSR46_04910, partial [Verrucomicrobia bacterium]|nr:hypothetical protein [Verrucomicrobiota bacterium]
MAADFDIQSVDLLKEHALLYLDSDNKVCLDRERGFLASLGRFFYSMVGVRDYRLEKIVSCFGSSWQGICEGETGKKNLEYLCGKVAKGCGIDEVTFEKIVLAEQLLKAPLEKEKRALAESFFQMLSESSALQTQLGSFQAKLCTVPEGSSLEAVLERAHYTHRWSELGLDISLFNNDYEGAKFLIQSRLIYQITGFQNSTLGGQNSHQIKTDLEGGMLIKKQGSYVAVSELIRKMEFDTARDELKTKGSEHEYWNYLSPDGLVAVDRWLHPEFVPVEKLSPAEMGNLSLHAKQFFPDGKEPPSEFPRDAVIQIFTNPRQVLPFEEFPLISRLAAAYPMHAAIRIITRDGDVYSTGFGADVEEY